MRKVWSLVAAGAFIVAVSASNLAHADGYGPGPSYVPRYYPTWSGLYVGVNGGYAWQDHSSVQLFSTGFVGFEQTPGFKASGGFGGGQIGYNIQTGQLVYGIEADIQGADVTDSFAVAGNGPFNPASVFTGHSRLDWFGTFRGRLGFSLDRTLLYATGGLAYGQVREGVQGATGGVVFYDVKGNDTLTGFVVGGGIEHKLAHSLSLKVEYQYIDLGSTTLTGPNGAFTGFSNHVDHQYQTVRLGLNYKFDDRREPGPLK